MTDVGGFLPNGVGPLVSGIVVVIFSMTGVEVVTIAAAESPEPGRVIRRTTNSVAIRVLLFFVLSTFLIVTIQPWNTVEPGLSPFVTVLDTIGVPGASTIMNIVVLAAVLSCLNSGLYTSSRMLFVLASRGEAPRWVTSIDHRGVPVKGVLACTAVGYGCVIAAFLWPDTVFLFLISSSGSVFLFVYLMICLSELKLRRHWERTAPERLVSRCGFTPSCRSLSQSRLSPFS
ncbi:amino acid permease [Nocardia thraciensis]